MKIPKVKKPSKKVLAKVHSLKEKKGMIAVIEPDSGEYFLGKTLLEALKKAEKHYPNKIFYSIRMVYTRRFSDRDGISLFSRFHPDFQFEK